MNLTGKLGHFLHVDLNSHQCKISSLPEASSPYLGGRGFNVWYLYHHLKKGTDPLSSENILLFSCGLMTGSSAPGSARLHINALSPLTGILGSSNIGGYAGPWLRSCNIASIVINGRAKKPVYLYIDSNGAQLKDASHIWGLDVFQTQDQLKRTYKDRKTRILTIGPAGEKGVRFATIMTERDHAAGRTGMGFVMGKKNLKAIVIAKGGHKHFPAVTSQQKSAVKAYTRQIKASSDFDFFSTHGGAGYVKWANDMGIMACKNYSEIGSSQIDKIDLRKFKKSIVRSSGCFRCPVQCKADLKLKGEKEDHRFTRPEFEPVLNLGPKCGLYDLNQIIKLDNLCSQLGIDSTSAATAIAFAMTLSEHHLLPEQLSDGLDLSWGNGKTMEILIHQMVQDKGLGKILRLGTRQAAEQIGNGAVDYAAHVKGLELTAYHPTAIMGSALGYAVSSRGGDYNNVYSSLEHTWTEDQAKKEFGTKEAVNIKSIKGKGRLIKKAIIANIIVDCLGLCKVAVLSLLKSYNLDHEAKLIHGLTGINFSVEDLGKAGQDIANLEKRFNLKHSDDEQTDKLPEMFFKKDPGNGLTREKFETMLQEYYQAMGWDENGVPQ